MFLNSSLILQMARFIAIGGLNTALDFLIFNMLATAFAVSGGVGLVLANVVSFSASLAHSYLWNGSWTFTVSENVWKTLIKSGGLAVLAAVTLGFAVLAAGVSLPWGAFLAVLVFFLLIELFAWYDFGLMYQGAGHGGMKMVHFVVVSLGGLVVNSLVLWLAFWILIPYADIVGGEGVARNIAKAFATLFSLVWNFLGYKLWVFKK